MKDEMNQSAFKIRAKKVTADCTEMVLKTNKMLFSLFKTLADLKARVVSVW
jgi:hypothetical protein